MLPLVCNTESLTPHYLNVTLNLDFSTIVPWKSLSKEPVVMRMIILCLHCRKNHIRFSV
ncbi:hypothetical protein BDF20DRAFT_876831 [Mycotypha africana]|uniref:uncharacterized protein n=1 Tax=Mycotypha africana TaxID=64632 RepID=UPI0023017833|nr:uncharacterized protein BDF20DRAFT_876831 [Mycotypha africana]KAI8975085.1 hypothetical protein BDF20DRAFT_876831 [Mycotypha africana]